MQMTEFDAIVAEERLTRWLRRGEPSGTAANKVCLFERGGIWQTVMTDERAGEIDATRRSFHTESAALDDALEGLRFLKDLLDFRL